MKIANRANKPEKKDEFLISSAIVAPTLEELDIVKFDSSTCESSFE